MRVAIIWPSFALLVSANDRTPASPLAALLGINCRGSSQCGGSFALPLVGLINKIPDGKIFGDGDHIARVRVLGRNICAFLQHTGTKLSAKRIKPLAAAIVRHKCKACGSVPIVYPGSNDPSEGMLTFNFVSWIR